MTLRLTPTSLLPSGFRHEVLIRSPDADGGIRSSALAVERPVGRGEPAVCNRGRSSNGGAGGDGGGGGWHEEDVNGSSKKSRAVAATIEHRGKHTCETERQSTSRGVCDRDLTVRRRKRRATTAGWQGPTQR
eukprot:6175500-Pleurochrysis_carterae.AAC.1